jgi:protoheme IX farnesyltransferase
MSDDVHSKFSVLDILKNYFSLLKPRVMSLSIFTSLVGIIIAPGFVFNLEIMMILFAISLGSGASGALNMWYERDLDKLMERTKDRVLPLGKVKPSRALIFGLTLSFVSVGTLYYFSNILAASILALTIFFYIFIYTIWLKKRTSQNIVIGGAAGAFPPMIGWAAVSGSLSLEILLIFAIIFVWTPPHFWALALYKSDDYERANIPMMPLIVGNKRTVNMIIAYSFILLPVAMSLSLYYSIFYSVSIFSLSAIFVYLSITLKLSIDKPNFEKKAQNLFFFSIFYLFNIFSIILIDNSIW